MMQLKNVIDSPCGVRYMLDELELQSGYARRWLLERQMMTTDKEIAAAYALLPEGHPGQKRLISRVNQNRCTDPPAEKRIAQI